MRVKRTKRGKFTFILHFSAWENLYQQLFEFIEYESAILPAFHLKDKNAVNRQIHLAILSDFFVKQLVGRALVYEKFLVSRIQALAILSFLTDCNGNIELQELKSGLHKLLN